MNPTTPEKEPVTTEAELAEYVDKTICDQIQKLRDMVSTNKGQALISLLSDVIATAANSHLGVMCTTCDCVFNSNGNWTCCLKKITISNGKCPHYNPDLTLADVCPGDFDPSNPNVYRIVGHHLDSEEMEKFWAAVDRARASGKQKPA
jgi:hypothetical protein